MEKLKKILKIITKIFGVILLIVSILFLLIVKTAGRSAMGYVALLLIFTYYPILYGGIIFLASWILYGIALLIIKIKNRKKESNNHLP